MKMNMYEVISQLSSRTVYEVSMLEISTGSWASQVYDITNPKKFRVYNPAHWPDEPNNVHQRQLVMTQNRIRQLGQNSQLHIMTPDQAAMATQAYSQDLVWLDSSIRFSNDQLDQWWHRVKPTGYFTGNTCAEQIEKFAHRNELRYIRCGETGWAFYKSQCCARECRITEDPINAYEGLKHV